MSRTTCGIATLRGRPGRAVFSILEGLLLAVSVVSCGKHPTVQPLSPLDNVARWPGTYGIATGSDAGFPVSNLNDGTPQAWGSTEQPGRDVYAALVLPTPQAIHEYRIALFSPAQPPRPHLRDIRVIAADSIGPGGPEWRVVRSRLSNDQPFSEKVTVPPLSDGSIIRIEVDPSDHNWGPHKIWGLGCFAASHGDAHNYLPQGTGTGVYLREFQLGNGDVQNLAVGNGTLSDRVLDFLASNMDAMAVLLIALLLLSSVVMPRLRFNERAPRLVSAGRTIAGYKSYFLILLVAAALTVGLLACVFRAFGTDKTLNWDETYYANIAVMGAHGHGLYPAIQNMLSTHIMGGVGYLAYLYVLAVKVFGATIYSLRFVALLAMIITLVPIYLTLRMWYDSMTGLVAAALAPAMYLYQLSNSARMDSITMAVTAWMLFLTAFALKKKRWGWHLVAGLVAGLALEAHIDTLAATAACGLLFLVSGFGRRSPPRAWLSVHNPVVPFVLGFGISFTAYIVFNVLPDVHGFFRAMSYARPAVFQHGTLSAASLFRSVISPEIIVNKEALRYHDLFQAMPLFESLVFFLSLIALAIRRTPGDKNVLVLLVGAMAGAALIFYNASPYYMTHLFPIAVLPVAPFFTRGFVRRSEVTPKNISPQFVAASIVAMVFLLHPSWGFVTSWPTLFTRSTDAPGIVARVQHAASPQCKIAGDRELYVPYFLNYPRYHSTVRTEEILGVLYRGGGSFEELWAALQPDVVFGALDERIRPYLEQTRYKLIGADIWLKTQTGLTKGCVITADPMTTAR